MILCYVLCVDLETCLVIRNMKNTYKKLYENWNSQNLEQLAVHGIQSASLFSFSKLNVTIRYGCDAQLLQIMSASDLVNSPLNVLGIIKLCYTFMLLSQCVRAECSKNTINIVEHGTFVTGHLPIIQACFAGII